jgi:hypothetical protein
MAGLVPAIHVFDVLAVRNDITTILWVDARGRFV